MDDRRKNAKRLWLGEQNNGMTSKATIRNDRRGMNLLFGVMNKWKSTATEEVGWMDARNVDAEE